MLFSGVVFAMLASCSESFPGIDYDKTQGKTGIENQDEWTSQTPIMVFVNDQDIFTIKTRGLGAFENNDTVNPIRLANSTFYVYAFRDTTYESGPEELRGQPDLRSWRYANNGPASFGPDVDNMNCLLDGPDYNNGLPLYLHAQGSGELRTTREGVAEETTYYYSSIYPQVPFNFFAYYLDDIVPTSTHRTADRIDCDIEIDGSQDLMCGYAPDLVEEIMNGKKSGIWANLNDDERRTILNVGGYCTFAAHRGIHPMVNLKHQLARLTFTAFPGDETASRIQIRGVEVESRYKGSFTVASRNLNEVGIDFSDERKPLALREQSDGVHPCEELGIYEVPYNDSMKDQKWYNRPSVKLGSSLLLSPDTIYTLNLYWNEWISRKEGEEPELVKHTKPIRYALSIDGGFEAGVEYPIMIAVYGSQPIQVFANVDGWKEGDPIKLDDPGDYEE